MRAGPVRRARALLPMELCTLNPTASEWWRPSDHSTGRPSRVVVMRRTRNSGLVRRTSRRPASWAPGRDRVDEVLPVREQHSRVVQRTLRHRRAVRLDALDGGRDPVGVHRAFEQDRFAVRPAHAQHVQHGCARLHLEPHDVPVMAPDLEAADRTPVLLVGDFNAPSHLDWTAAAAPLHGGHGPVDWPVSRAVERAGLRDSYREAHPDQVECPGTTWSPVHPEHEDGSGRPEPQDRIDYVLHAGGRLTVLDSTTLATGRIAPRPYVAANEWPSDHAAVVTTFRYA